MVTNLSFFLLNIILSLSCNKNELSNSFIAGLFFSSKLDISIILKFFFLLSILKALESKLLARITSKNVLFISLAIDLLILKLHATIPPKALKGSLATAFLKEIIDDRVSDRFVAELVWQRLGYKPTENNGDWRAAVSLLNPKIAFYSIFGRIHSSVNAPQRKRRISTTKKQVSCRAN